MTLHDIALHYIVFHQYELELAATRAQSDALAAAHAADEARLLRASWRRSLLSVVTRREILM